MKDAKSNENASSCSKKIVWGKIEIWYRELA